MLDWIFKAAHQWEDPQLAIERRHKEAHKSGFVDAFLGLYFPSLRYLPSRTTNGNRE